MRHHDELEHIARKYLLWPERVLVGMRRESGRAYVYENYVTWDVVLRAMSGFTVYSFRRHSSFGGWRAVAALPDGQTFSLDWPDEFRAFYAATRSAISPRELAELLVKQQSTEREIEHVVYRSEDLAVRLSPEQAQRYDPQPLRAELGDDGSLCLWFWTFSFEGELSHRGTLNVNRWDVAASAAGEISWVVHSVARHIDAPHPYREPVEASVLTEEHPSASLSGPSCSPTIRLDPSVGAETVSYETAERLALQYCPVSASDARAVEDHPDGVLVRTAAAAYLVHSLTLAKWFSRSDGYTLYRITTEKGEGPRLIGVASLPDGRRFELRREEEMRAFYRASKPPLAPEEVATLLALFQSTVADEFEHLFVRDEDLRELLGTQRLEALALSPPRTTRAEDNSRQLDFFTFVTLVGDEIQVVFRRWHVDVSPNGDICWSSTPIAHLDAFTHLAV